MNRLKTLVLLSTLTALLLWAGHAMAGQGGLMMALVFAALMNFGAYWWSDKIVLRMYGAREVTEAQAPALHGLVRELAGRAGLRLPKVYIIPQAAPNAFATGRNPEHAAVAVTEGLTSLLDREELAAVVAHELGHVQNRDTLIMTVAATIAGAVGMLANLAHFGVIFGSGRSSDGDDRPHPLAGLLGVILAPIAATLIQLAISRSREFVADATGARLSGNPLALAEALRKLETVGRQVPMSAGSPATAHLFIVNPFSGGGLAGLFATHPSTAARIRRLEIMAGHPVSDRRR
jgi:heat shock protein HtpX